MKNLSVITIQKDHLTDFAAERNRQLQMATTDWVLFLDSDEKLSPALKRELATTLAHPSFSAYRLPRRDTFMGQTLGYGEAGRARFVRLARRDWGQWHRPVHEVWLGPGRVGELHNPILHHPHPSLSSFLTKIDHYSTLEVNYRYRQGRRATLAHVFFYPLLKFKYNYLIRLGFLDGVPGLIHALMMSFHSYLTWSKLYILWRTK